MKGHQNKSDGLWDIYISKPLRHRSHVIIKRNKTKTQIIKYQHGYCFIPTPRTFLKKINNGNFLTWLGLNNQTSLKHLPSSIETALGHLYQERKNLQLTNQVKYELDIEECKDFYADIEKVKKHEVCATLILFNIKRKGFSNLTVDFPHKSSRGNVYVTVMYEYDINAIQAKPIKNMQVATICDDFLNMHKILKSRESKPKFYMMENECSNDSK